MTVDLELSVLQPAQAGQGFIASFAITDRLIVAAGGVTTTGPIVLASSNARHFERRTTPRELGLRDVLAVGDAVWVCGEYGLLAVTRDGGATWTRFETQTDVCLFGLALAPDGAVWVVGENGFAARVLGERAEKIDLGTTTRLMSVYSLREEIVVLGGDGNLYRWRGGEIIKIATGTNKALTGLVITKHGTWIAIGDDGFIARSPDGAWFSRVNTGVEIDLEAVAVGQGGQIVVVGERGAILVSRDDGRTWRPHATDLVTHLWSVERFGGGVLIGGDDGLVLKLAPVGDDTWSDRINVFGGVRPLDPVFADGPVGFIERGLPRYLASIAAQAPAPDGDHEEGEEGETEASDIDREPFKLLNRPGGLATFETTYGVPLPPEAARFFAAVEGTSPWGTFRELRLDADVLPDVGDKNLFELLVRRDQQAFLATGLVEAFCGVFCIGSLGNGDTYHMELYQWDGPRQVLHFDHDEAAFSGVFADSLDSLAYLAALKRAVDDGTVSRETFAIGLRKLRGKVAPSWHFSIKDDDPDFVMLDPKRRDTEFFFYRSRWITALLKNDGVTDIDDIPGLFNADFNQIVPQDQLPARFEACEKFSPTALYSMWRAFLFDEPELVRYLEIARRHRSRIVRDAAILIDELRAGRNELGTIKDVRAHLAAFRALDLDPRRSEARKTEAEARARQDASRTQEVLGELARTPRSQWTDLAWRWLDDGIAHRALLQKLDDQPDMAAQIAALDQLRELRDDERELMLPRIASELTPELEAILVGSLVRGDALEGVLAAPIMPDGGGDEEEPEDDDDDDDEVEDGVDEDADSDEDESPGWDAIDAALAPVYAGAEPHAHYGTVLPYMLGGNDPLHGISVYLRTEPVPHFHFVTYGFTDLFTKETDDPEISGFGFELTLRLARRSDETTVPTWALNFLQNLARYVFSTGNRFAAGHKMGLNGPIALGQDTEITAVLFTDEPELGAIESEYGAARFLQVVGITDDEYRLIQEWSTTGLVEMLARTLPLLVTDVGRRSILTDATTASEVRRRVDAEGSSEDLSFAGELGLAVDNATGQITIELGALYAASLPRAMRGRLRLGRVYALRGREHDLRLEPADERSATLDDGDLTLALTPDVIAEITARLDKALAGTYRLETWPQLTIIVTPTIIRDQDGTASAVRGVSEAEAQRLIAEDRAQRAGDEPGDVAADEDDDQEDEDDDQEDEDDDDDVPPREQVLAALRMTERALRFAPDDDETQYTHGMLLLDAERAGVHERIDELLRALPGYTRANRLHLVAHMGEHEHDRFAEALDILLENPLPAESEHLTRMSDLSRAVVRLVPSRLGPLVSLLPDHVSLLANLAWYALQEGHKDHALAVYERVLALPIPEAGAERTNYLGAINNACVQAHAVKAYETAVRIAERAQSVAHENPYIYHSAACAYAAVGNHDKAFEQVKLAVKHDYEHLAKVEVDTDLGPLLDWPEFKALFRDWRARQEGN